MATPSKLNSTPSRQELAQILDSLFPHKSFTPHDVVEVARDPHSPLHKYFEWDNSKAAEKYRLQQARQLISVLFVTVENDMPKRLYESVVLSDGGRKYVHTDVIEDSPELLDQVLASALKEVRFWATKYSQYHNNFKEIFIAIDEIQRRFNEQKERGVVYNGDGGEADNSSAPHQIRQDNNRRRQPAIG